MSDGVVIVAGPGDGGAASLVQVLLARGSPVTVLEPAWLAAARWAHALDGSGRPSTTIGLPDGRWVRDREVGAVLCRTAAFPQPRFDRSPAADRDYAAVELTALVVSWLRGLGDRVVNGVDGVSPVGPSWTPWRALDEARRAGLPVATPVVATSGRLVPGFRGSPYDARRPLETAPGEIVDRVVVVGSRAYGGPAGVGPACVRLAERARCRLLEVGFCRGADGGLVAGSVSSVPALTDPSVVHAVADLLERISGARAVAGAW